MGAVGDLVGNIPVVGDIYNEGKQGNQVKQSSSSGSGINLRPESELEKQATGDISGQYGQLKDLLSRGPGASAVDASNQQQQSFVDMLKQISSTGGMPSADDQARAQQFTQLMFQPQQVALDQNFQQQNQQAARLAAQLNRPINDPIIQSKLRQEQSRQQSLLNANQSASQAQEARNQPYQRLGLQGQLADAQAGLASQAVNNRMQLLNLGNSLQSQERNWRLQTSDKWGTGSQTQQSGGGILGGIGALTGVAGSVGGALASFSPMGGGSAPSVSGAQATPAMSPFSGQIGGQQGSYGGSYFQPQMTQAASQTSRFATSPYSAAPPSIARPTGGQPGYYQSAVQNAPWGSGIGY